MIKNAIIALSTLAASTAFANTIDTTLVTCLDSAQSTAAYTTCYDSAAQAWDKILNVTYKGLRSHLSQNTQATLLGSQRSWLAFRDAENAFAGELFYNVLQGTMHRPMATAHVMRIIKTRVVGLDKHQGQIEYRDPLYQNETETDVTRIDEQMNQCLAVATANQEQVSCVVAAHQAWDRELNVVYKQFSVVLPEVAQSKLQLVQRAWMTFRDSETAFSGDFYTLLEGSMYQTVHAFNLMNLTRERTLELATFASRMR